MDEKILIKCDKCGTEMDTANLDTIGVVENGWAFCPNHAHGAED